MTIHPARIVLVVLLVLVIEETAIEDEDEDEEEISTPHSQPAPCRDSTNWRAA